MKHALIFLAILFSDYLTQAQEIKPYVITFNWLECKTTDATEWESERKIDIKIIFNKDGVEGKIVIRAKETHVILPTSNIEKKIDDDGEYQQFSGLDQNGKTCNINWRPSSGILEITYPERDWITRFIHIDNFVIASANNSEM